MFILSSIDQVLNIYCQFVLTFAVDFLLPVVLKTVKSEQVRCTEEKL